MTVRPSRPTVTALLSERLRQCPTCGLWFAPVRVTARYCDRPCKVAAARARRTAALPRSRR